MNKKFISALLFGAMAIASTSTFVSCKDYDDDIDELHALVDQNSAALTAAKSALEAEIATLKTQMETKDAELASLIQAANAATAENKDAIAKEILRATQAEAALEARIVTAEKAIADIQTVLAGKVDKSEFDSTVKDIYAKLETVTTGLGKAMESIEALKKGLADEETARKAVAADLAQQVAALEALTKRVAAIEGDYLKAADKKALEDKIEEVRKALATQIAELSDNVAANTKSINELKTLAENLSKMVDGISAELNTLNVLVKSALRSIVFIPDAYYWGIEATSVKYLAYDIYTLSAANVDNKLSGNQGAFTTGALGKTGYVNDISLSTKVHKSPTDHTKHASSKDGFDILDFTATYHLNPSNADLANAKFTILSDDKAYINTRAAAAGLSYDSHTVVNGDLKVKIDITNPAKIQTVPANQKVTVFATQITLNTEGQDTTITSDYATLYADHIKDVVIAHKKNPMTGVTNDHCGECNLTPSVNSTKHLMATATEAASEYEAQDTCDYNKTLDLRTLVETHYTDTDGNHKVLNISNYGLSYKFELVGLWYGGNKTSESAHAAINPADGYTFRPQMPSKEVLNSDGTTQVEGGKQLPYEQGAQERTTIGRTPLVRVSLVNEAGEIIDYGYIRIRISETKTGVDPEAPWYKPYTLKDYNYTCNDVCNINFPAWEDQNRWDQIEHDLYSHLGLSKADFERYYDPVLYAGTGNIFAQYEQRTNGSFSAIPQANAYGIIQEIVDDGPEETTVIRWKLTSADAMKYFYTQGRRGLTVAVKYQSTNEYERPSVYVLFKMSANVAINGPMAVVNWDDAKIANYWYEYGSANRGKYEIRTNTLAPEDAHVTSLAGQPFDNDFRDVFKNNIVVSSSYMTLTNARYSNISWNLVFDKKNMDPSHVYGGVDGDSYKLRVTDDNGNDSTMSPNNTYGKYLRAYKSTTTYTVSNSQLIAKLVYDASGIMNPDHTVIEYQHGDYAHALLNYKSHLALSDATVTTTVLDIVVSLDGQMCEWPVQMSNNSFDVRFLRPINVEDNVTEVTDAATDTLQVINLRDLVKLSDWRSTTANLVWKDENVDYWKYYNVKSITVLGAPNTSGRSINAFIYSNINRNSNDTIIKNNTYKLSLITDEVEFQYYPEAGPVSQFIKNDPASYGYIVYKNLSSTVDKFKVLIPLKIEYEWGYVISDVTVTVNRTSGNAKPHK